MSSELRSGSLADRLARVRARIRAAAERAARDSREITLVAASKTQATLAIREAAACGVTDFGENYLQEGLAKLNELAEEGGAQPFVHFIGHLQTNKAAAAVRFASLQSLDSARLLAALAAAKPSAPLPVFIQVNIAAEASKGGVTAAELSALVAAARVCPAVELRGLMTIPPPGADPETSRPYFRELHRLAELHGLRELSMGMTDDFEVAIEEGATHIRVGRAIFGERVR